MRTGGTANGVTSGDVVRSPEQPKWALVLWPSRSMGCIPIENVMVATMRGAIVLADERYLLPWPLEVEPAQSNPNRVEE